MTNKAHYLFDDNSIADREKFTFDLGNKSYVFVRRHGRLVNAHSGEPLEIVPDGKALGFRLP